MCNLLHDARDWQTFKNWNVGGPLNFAGCTQVEATWRMAQQQLRKPWLVNFVGQSKMFEDKTSEVRGWQQERHKGLTEYSEGTCDLTGGIYFLTWGRVWWILPSVEVLAESALQGGKEAGFYLSQFSSLAHCVAAQIKMHHEKAVARGAGANEVSQGFIKLWPEMTSHGEEPGCGSEDGDTCHLPGDRGTGRQAVWVQWENSELNPKPA